MMRDQELLRDYLGQKSEAAFAELVRRHLDLVYDTALRLLGGDASLAEDVAQTVFIDLARKADKLAGYATVAGWLHTRTRFAALDTIRAERRRRTRENTASAMNDPLQHAIEDSTLQWIQIEPLLDHALGELKQSDRDAVLLRFLEGKSLREVGEVLGVQENAARMRVDRALEKLRQILAKKGLSSTAAALSVALAGHSLAAAPAGLASALTGAAAGLGTSCLSFMTLANLKIGMAGAAIVIGLTTPLLIQHRQLASLRFENEKLRAALAERATAADPAAELLNRASEADEAQRRRDHSELLRLRGQVGVLRRQLADAASSARKKPAPASEDDRSATAESLQAKKAPAEVWELGKYLSRDEWQDAGSGAPEDSLQTLFWALTKGSSERLAELSMTNAFVSDETPREIAEKLQSGKLRIASKTVAFSTAPDYRQLLGGRVAFKIEKSPRELQMNVDEEWPGGRKVQSVWTLRLEDGQWKFPPAISSLLRQAGNQQQN